jgi:chlorophyllide a reductase subunit Y
MALIAIAYHSGFGHTLRQAQAVAAGAGSVAATINAAIGNRARFTEMREFFSGVGEGATAGVWPGAAKTLPDTRASKTKAKGEDGSC